MRRRDLFPAAATLMAGGAMARNAFADQPPRRSARREYAVSAAEFGAVGDGETDDTKALQAALDATAGAEKRGFLVIPPGDYKVTRTLRIEFPPTRRPRQMTRFAGISGYGARIRSAITDGSDVLSIVSRTLVRFYMIEGLGIYGSGSDGDGISIDCQASRSYFYNTVLRDIAVESCGGDGCRMTGCIFESQLFNCYLRDNSRNGITMANGRRPMLSAMHVFGCVFGGNKQYGAELVGPVNDVSFHGCYFLLNGKYGLVAPNGCLLLSHSGFENNHKAAPDFESGGAGINLGNFGTLIGCKATSNMQQTHLIKAYVLSELVMIGCIAGGEGRARNARLARLKGGGRKAQATLIGCSGGVDYEGDLGAIQMGQNQTGARFGSRWNEPNLLSLGDHTLWVDDSGVLRMKQGRPRSETDGKPVGA